MIKTVVLSAAVSGTFRETHIQRRYVPSGCGQLCTCIFLNFHNHVLLRNDIFSWTIANSLCRAVSVQCFLRKYDFRSLCMFLRHEPEHQRSLRPGIRNFHGHSVQKRMTSPKMQVGPSSPKKAIKASFCTKLWRNAERLTQHTTERRRPPCTATSARFTVDFDHKLTIYRPSHRTIQLRFQH